MAEGVTRFLGGSPLRVAVKLAVASLIVGFFMAYFGWSPMDVIDGLVETVRRIWNMGFSAINQFVGYILLGAVIVVPIFFVLRLLNYRK